MRTLFLLTAVFVFASRADAGDKKYNVLFIFTDDQRADTIAALGNSYIKTPNLDRLAREGTAFTRGYCMGSMQGAVCVPSRAMLMTGRTLFRVNSNLEKQTTWPEMFARAGYVTFLTGKWHNGPASAARAFMQGKSIFLGGMTNPFAANVVDRESEKKLGPKRSTAKHSVEQFTDEAVEFLRAQKQDRPFLAYVAFNLPHDPRTAPPKYHEYYNANKPPLPPNFLPQHPFNNGEMAVRDEQLAPWPRTPEIVRQHLADYYSCITFLDEQVGRMLEALRQAGQYENTIIVFASDSGLAIGSHGLFGKQSVYDHSMRVPLLMAGPGIPKGQQKDALVYLLDLFPTLGDMNGIKAPEGSEGQSLTPILQGKKTAVRDSIFLAYRDVQRAVRDDRWHLIVYPHINKTQLFDLKEDPHELKDLSQKETEQVRRMTGMLTAWQAKLGDGQSLTSAKPQALEFDFSKVTPTKKK